MILWRISNHADLRGVGGRRSAGRWHVRGVPVVYLAESAALAMLETLIHFELAPDEAPADFQLLEVQCPDDIGIMSLESSRLAEGWRTDRPLTQRLGSEWLRSRSSALLRVPSAIVPNSFNFLFNPLHDQAVRVSIRSSRRHPYDARLFSRSNR